MALNLLEPSSFQLRVDIQVLPAMGFELLPKAASELDCWPVPVPVLSGWQSPCQWPSQLPARGREVNGQPGRARRSTQHVLQFSRYTLACILMARITRDSKRVVSHGFCHFARPSLRCSGTSSVLVAKVTTVTFKLAAPVQVQVLLSPGVNGSLSSIILSLRFEWPVILVPRLSQGPKSEVRSGVGLWRSYAIR